jgi:sortase (surface protein transpeptidase)
MGPVLKASIPTRLDIPSIGVRSDLMQLGLNPDHTVQVPPLGRDSRAGWYKGSPTPGQLGPAVLLGHVDSSQFGPGVFFKLGALRPGDMLTVTRADHTAAVFRIDRVVSYAKDHFPTLEVYGNTDHSALRLITCGGTFNISSHSYESNIVAYASLVSSHPA